MRLESKSRYRLGSMRVPLSFRQILRIVVPSASMTPQLRAARIRTSPFLVALISVAGWLSFSLPKIAVAEDSKPENETILRETFASYDGGITFWLASPPGEKEVKEIETAPKPARAGDAFAGGGKWQHVASEASFNNLRTKLDGARKGHVWCSTRVLSRAGGTRSLEAYSYCGMKVFLNGKLVVHKPEPLGFDADSKTIRLELPKGESHLAVAVGIRWGYCGFLVRLTGTRKPQAVAGDRFALAFPPGSALSAGALMADAVSFVPERRFVDADQMISLGVGLRGGWPCGIGSLTPRVKGPDGKPVELKLPARAPDELRLQPWRFRYRTPKTVPSRMTLTCELLAGEKVLGEKKLVLYSLPGIRTEADALRVKVQAAVAKQPVPNAMLALEKIDLWLDRLSDGPKRYPMQGSLGVLRTRVTDQTGETLLGLLEEVRTYLQEETAGKDPFALRTGFLERAYLSRIDDSAQPYFVMVPESARPALAAPKGDKKFPLIIFLHGYVEEYHKHKWWTADPVFNGMCARQGAFLAIPFARSNADFLGPGEVDVLDVLKELKRLYPIDPDRVYLYGYSMGGMGVYSLGGHYPDLWAAGIVIAGRADSPLLMGTLGFDTLHPFKQFLIRVDQPIDLCENFVNIPLRIFHGRDDTIIPTTEAQRMETRLKKIGCEATLKLYPGDHWFGFDLMADPAHVKWLLTKRRPSKPKSKRVKNYSVRFGGHRGIQVNHLTGKLEPFDINWTTSDQGAPQVHLAGSLTEVVLGIGKTGKVEGPEGGEPLKPGRVGDVLESTVFSVTGWGEDRKGSAWNPAWKSPVRCGPVKEAMYGPFIVAYGTTGGAGTTALLKTQAKAFADEWYLFAKGLATVKADQDVTDEDKRDKNLILFGQEQENALHALAAKTGKLPISVKDNKVTVGDKTVSLESRGVLWIYPSPFEGAGADRSIVISAGVRYGMHLPINHKHDLVPDFLIYTGDMDTDGTRTNRPVAAGFFDGKWKFNKKTTWWFPE